MYIQREAATDDQHLCDATALKIKKPSIIIQLKIQEGLLLLAILYIEGLYIFLKICYYVTYILEHNYVSLFLD